MEANKTKKKISIWLVSYFILCVCVYFTIQTLIFFLLPFLQLRSKEIKNLTKRLLDDDDELKPMDFLRQLAFENAKLTDQFTKFYEKAPESSGSESSDDESEFAATQSTASLAGSSQSTLSQLSVVDSGDEFLAPTSFDFSNEDVPTIATPMDISDELATSSFDISNENVPTISTAMDVDESTPISTNEPTILVGCRQFSIVAPTVEEGMQLLIKEKREKEERQQQQRLAILEQLEREVPETNPTDCEICSLGVKRDTFLVPCGHTCCNKCWVTQTDAYQKKWDSAWDYRLHVVNQITTERDEPPCLFCRTPVKTTYSLFL